MMLFMVLCSHNFPCREHVPCMTGSRTDRLPFCSFSATQIGYPSNTYVQMALGVFKTLPKVSTLSSHLSSRVSDIVYFFYFFSM
jgi:hypothetical protein